MAQEAEGQACRGREAREGWLWAWGSWGRVKQALAPRPRAVRTWPGAEDPCPFLGPWCPLPAQEAEMQFGFSPLLSLQGPGTGRGGGSLGRGGSGSSDEDALRCLGSVSSHTGLSLGTRDTGREDSLLFSGRFGQGDERPCAGSVRSPGVGERGSGLRSPGGGGSRLLSVPERPA